MSNLESKRLSLWARFKARFKAWWQLKVWFVKSQLLHAKLEGKGTEALTEAQRSLRKICAETGIAPDCVSAQILRGGCAIVVKHNDAQEAFVHNSYPEAATKAIEWLKEVRGLKTDKVSNMTKNQAALFGKRQQRFNKRKSRETRH
jgi:hypothetical protein